MLAIFIWSLILKYFIEVQEKKKKVVVLCSGPPQNVKLGTFMPWTCNDGKEMLLNKIKQWFGGSTSTKWDFVYLIPGRIGIWKRWFFEERGKPEYAEKNLSEQRREPTTNLTHIWRLRRDLNPGHIGGRRTLSPLRHPLLPEMYKKTWSSWKVVVLLI